MPTHEKDLEFKPMKLKFCVNCGQKQHSPIQKFCSNCGTPYDKPDFDIEPAENAKSTASDKNIARGIGGFLIIPYLGFYSSVLVGLIVLVHGNYSSLTQILLHLFIGFGLIVTGVASIILIHQKRVILLGWVSALYLFNLIEAINYAVINGSPWTGIGGFVGFLFWLIYFGNSRRVKQLLGIKHDGTPVMNAGWKTALTTIFIVMALLVVVLSLAANAQNSNNRTVQDSTEATNSTSLNSCIDSVDTWFNQTATTNGLALALLSNKEQQITECQSKYPVLTSSTNQTNHNSCIDNVDTWWAGAAPTVGLANYLLTEKQEMVSECQARYPI